MIQQFRLLEKLGRQLESVTNKEERKRINQSIDRIINRIAGNSEVNSELPEFKKLKGFYGGKYGNRKVRRKAKGS